MTEFAEFKTQSDTITEIATALVAFQAETKGVKKTAENPYFHSKYAELSDVWDEIRVPLTKNGLAVVQSFVGEALVTTLVHTSGEWFRGALKLSPAKPNDPQAQGSAITYARRYALQAITGIAPIDDDGNAGSGRENENSRPEPSRQPAGASKPVPAIPGVQKGLDAFGDLYTGSFKLSDPIPSKQKVGKFYRKAIDEKQNTFYVHKDAVCRDLQVAGDQPVTVKLKTENGFTSIEEVLSKVA